MQSHTQIKLQLHHQYDLKPHNTLACPSLAEHYCKASTIDDIYNALSYAKEHGLNLHVLGGGSNVLAQPLIKGLVLQAKLQGCKVVKKTAKEQLVAFGAGENWHKCVVWAVEQGLYGIENLALIPGDIGAAPIQNIGAYGVELKDCFHSLSAINTRTQQVEIFTYEQCQFGYRESVFKQADHAHYIIIEVVLSLSNEFTPVLNYPGLNDALKTHTSLTASDVLAAVIAMRSEKLPNPKAIPNAGSFFKNPVVSHKQFELLKKQYPHIVGYPSAQNQMKIPAAWLIDTLGFKGQNIGGIVVHHKQALVLTNPHHHPVSYVLDTAQHIQHAVSQHFGITLEIEPRLFG